MSKICALLIINPIPLNYIFKKEVKNQGEHLSRIDLSSEIDENLHTYWCKDTLSRILTDRLKHLTSLYDRIIKS